MSYISIPFSSTTAAIAPVPSITIVNRAAKFSITVVMQVVVINMTLLVKAKRSIFVIIAIIVTLPVVPIDTIVLTL